MTSIVVSLTLTAAVFVSACDVATDTRARTPGPQPADDTGYRPTEALMTPTDESAFVEIRSGGAFSGGVTQRLYATGVLVTERSRPGGDAGPAQTRTLSPAAFDAAYRAAREGLAAAATANDRPCRDGMPEAVRIFDGQSVVAERSANCGDPALTAILRSVENAIGIPELDPYGGPATE